LALSIPGIYFPRKTLKPSKIQYAIYVTKIQELILQVVIKHIRNVSAKNAAANGIKMESPLLDVQFATNG
jgi:hypothetical protein